MSDIRVFVAFPVSAAVFAGETLQCKITFRNVAQKPGSRPGGASGSPNTTSSHPQQQYPGGAPRAQLPVNNARWPGRLSPRTPSASSLSPSAAAAGQRPYTASSPKPPSLPSLPSIPAAANSRPSPNGHKHKRSVSIVSIGSDVGLVDGAGARPGRDVGLRSPPSSSATTPTRSRAHHGRSASLQIATGRHMNGTTPPSAIVPARSAQVPQTPRAHQAEALDQFSFPARKHSTPITPISPGTLPRHAKVQSACRGMPELGPAFAPVPKSVDPDTKNTARSGRIRDSGDASHRTPPPIDEPEYEQIPSARLIPAQSVGGDTPRSSGEFYSMSNSTTETLLSEYDPKRPVRPAHNRRHSLLSIGPKHSESLMMGYAQVTGSFTLDGSLVQTGVFDQVKRKAVVGTQSGGGVVGIETSKADGGFLSGFGWGLGGLLGGGGMSSIAEMKNVAGTKSIPILSTPQSILFVDLRLAPGESRSYIYKFTLPRSIPPSHRGKAIKITYNLVLGTQRPGKGAMQPTVIEIPFRVFPNVHGNGSLHAHDLMTPVVLLRDEAVTCCLDEPWETRTPPPRHAKTVSKQESSLQDFLSYVDKLLAPQDSGYNAAGSLGLLSPSFAPNLSKRLSIYDNQPTACKDVVEMAILGGGGGNSGFNGGHCIFEIARNRRRVAAITMARPAYKLGESITAIIDFTNAEIPCYHIHAALESSEKVDPALALRSPSSIYRATRKVYAQHSESTLFANRVIFTPTIPSSASPEFATSGIRNSWVLRFEFVTSAIHSSSSSSASDSSRGQLGGGPLFVDDLLEQTSYGDDQLYEPRQGISVESFDASIPVKIYPNGAADSGSVFGGGAGGGAGGIVGVHTAASVGFAV